MIITQNHCGSTYIHRYFDRNVNKERIDIKTCMLYSIFCINKEEL